MNVWSKAVEIVMNNLTRCSSIQIHFLLKLIECYTSIYQNQLFHALFEYIDGSRCHWTTIANDFLHKFLSNLKDLHSVKRKASRRYTFTTHGHYLTMNFHSLNSLLPLELCCLLFQCTSDSMSLTHPCLENYWGIIKQYIWYILVYLVNSYTKTVLMAQCLHVVHRPVIQQLHGHSKSYPKALIAANNV